MKVETKITIETSVTPTNSSDCIEHYSIIRTGDNVSLYYVVHPNRGGTLWRASLGADLADAIGRALLKPDTMQVQP